MGFDTTKHTITREIGIDMGHRVTHHGSKCRNLHGHRYRIEVTCEGELFQGGEQEGMVLDFGFLKDIMMREIDEPCDHGMCLWVYDEWIRELCFHDQDLIKRKVEEDGYYSFNTPFDGHNVGGKYYIIPFVPTAENLAKHWYYRLAPHVRRLTEKRGQILKVKVWETPNCSAEFPLIG